MNLEELSFCTESDMYIGETIVGYQDGKISHYGRYMGGKRIIGKLVELLVVCPDIHPGWFSVKAKVEVLHSGPN